MWIDGRRIGSEKGLSMGIKDFEAVFQACPDPYSPEACVHQAGMSDMSELPDVKDNSHGS